VLYIWFVGLVLESPLTRPFRRRGVLALAAGLGLAQIIIEFLAPYAFWPTGHRDPYGGWFWDASTLNIALNLETLALYAFVIIATVDAYRRALPGTLQRARARAYLVAFATIDASVLALSTTSFLLPSSYYGVDVEGAAAWWGIGWNVVQFAGIFLVVRGMLRYQLFDFDLKVKWTLKRGTLVAIVLCVFLVAAEIAEQYLQGYGFVVGGVAIGLLLFAIRPIERAIDRMADRAMPKTTGTPEYLAQRKHQIYRAAIEDAMRDGSVSSKERALLLRLAENLGLSADESTRIERTVLEASA
jgi:hypothetical protein